MRTFGVEEELLLVDRVTGQPLPLARAVLAKAGPRAPRVPGVALEGEMQQEMIEVVGPPHESLARLHDHIVAGRAFADSLARDLGARAVALATSPVAVSPHASTKLRYRTMMQTYGVTARRSLTCGFHVHVSIASREEGVAVLDRIRAWLPVLVALAANSPFEGGIDTGHASYRAMEWRRWPCSGPNEVFGSVEAYDGFEEQLLSTGVLLDEGMLYFDARLSRHHPTVEMRVADVCLLPEDAATLAALSRALVDTAADEWKAGIDASAVSACVLKLASWRAALSGVRGPLVHPADGQLADAGEVVGALFEHVREALQRNGDHDAVAAGLAAIVGRGSGADMQRKAYLRMGTMVGVVRDATRLTHESPKGFHASSAPREAAVTH